MEEERQGEEVAGVDDYTEPQHTVMKRVKNEYCYHWMLRASHCLPGWMAGRRYQHRTAREDEAHNEKQWRGGEAKERMRTIPV